MKVWKIECCARCPKFGTIYDISGSYEYCYSLKKKININTFNGLPKWCPLEEWKEDK